MEPGEETSRTGGSSHSPSTTGHAPQSAPPSEWEPGGRAPLPPHRVDEGPAGRRAFLEELFDATAADYDWINALMSLGTGRSYRRRELGRAAIGEGMTVVDLGTGTGMLAALSKERTGPTGRVIGVDPSVGMLQRAGATGVDRVRAVAERLPLADATVDRITMGYALRHVPDLRHAFAEFYRVLRPGGRLLILEMTRPDGPWQRALLEVYIKHVVAGLARLRSRHLRDLMRYYWETIDHCVPPETILEAMGDAGLTEPQRHVTGGVFSAYTAVKPRRQSHVVRRRSR